MISAEEAVKLTPSDNLDDAMLLIENSIKDATSVGHRSVFIDTSRIDNFIWISEAILDELHSCGYSCRFVPINDDLRIYW